MRAVVLERFGEPSQVLQVRDLPTPEPKAGQVRVRMLASPINPSDLMVVRGLYARLPSLPATPGFEGVGIVERAGSGWLGRYLLGKRVAVLNAETGSWAEFAIVAARQAIPLSPRLPLEQAAMFFVNPATAYLMTRRVLQVPRGAWLLQTAAGSALGHMVVRLGRRFGFRTLNVVRRGAQGDELRRLGGDAVIVSDGSDLHEQILRETGGQGVPYAIDAVGGVTGSEVARGLAVGGRMLVYGTLSGEPLSIGPRDLITTGARIEGFWLGHWMAAMNLIGKLRLVRTLNRLVADGTLASPVGDVFTLDEISTAARRAEQPGRGGKVLLKIGET